MPTGGGSQIVSDTGYDIWDLFETQGAFPSTVWIDHEMRVYDTMNNAGSWSIGNRIDDMLEACGDLCIDGEVCSSVLGDINQDDVISILDLVTLVNYVLGLNELDECQLETSDMNIDGIINIQDLILLVNAVLGLDRGLDVKLDSAELIFINENNKLYMNIRSKTPISGIELKVNTNKLSNIYIEDEFNFNEFSSFNDNVQTYLAFSYDGESISSEDFTIILENTDLVASNINVILSSNNGQLIESKINFSESHEINNLDYQINNLYPNPFNPEAQISYSVPKDGLAKLIAYDVNGRQVSIIENSYHYAGQHQLAWDASDLSSGIYFVQLISDEYVSNMKQAILIK